MPVVLYHVYEAKRQTVFKARSLGEFSLSTERNHPKIQLSQGGRTDTNDDHSATAASVVTEINHAYRTNLPLPTIHGDDT